MLYEVIVREADSVKWTMQHFGVALGLLMAVAATYGAEHFVQPRVFNYDTSALAPAIAKQWENIWYNATDVSLIRLIATPRDFDHTPVRVTGLLMTTEFGILLFLDRDSYSNSITENAITIVLHESFIDPITLPDAEGRYVTVVGEFRDEHSGQYYTNGSLYNVLPIKPGHIHPAEGRGSP